MPLTWRHALVGAAVLFVIFLLAKMRPSVGGRSQLSADVRAARDRAHAATTPEARGTAYADAGEAAAKQGRWTASAGFFLRAMLAVPTSAELVERTARALEARRPRLLEKMFWRRLAQLPWDDAHAPALGSVASTLGRAYRGKLHDKTRAAVLEKLSSRWPKRGDDA
jgi:hypothetical protein